MKASQKIATSAKNKISKESITKTSAQKKKTKNIPSPNKTKSASKNSKMSQSKGDDVLAKSSKRKLVKNTIAQVDSKSNQRGVKEYLKDNKQSIGKNVYRKKDGSLIVSNPYKKIKSKSESDKANTTKEIYNSLLAYYKEEEVDSLRFKNYILALKRRKK